MGNIVHSSQTTIATYSFDNSARYSFLAVAEPLTPFIYRREGKDAESIMIQSFDKQSNRIAHMTGERSQINQEDFLEHFVYVEFYFNQLIKLCIIDSFTISQWMKLEHIVASEALSMRAKMEIMKKLDVTIWGSVKPHFSDLQALRNAMAHSPVGPYRYCGEDINWDVIDEHMVTLTTNLLTAYKKIQNPVLDFMKRTGIDITE